MAVNNLRYEENSSEEEKGEPFFPHHVIKQGIVILLSLGVLLTLVTFLPAPMEPKADPFSTPEHIKPEWYFLAAYQFLKVAERLDFLGQWAPKVIGVLGQGIVVFVLLLLPFLDTGESRHPKKRPIFTYLGIIGIIGFIIFTIWGHYS
jgi:quinol-cytochrome oxidoreductase complex cytochrome b subunit